jgi:hypothetical protein
LLVALSSHEVGRHLNWDICFHLLVGKELRELQKQQAHLKTELASLTAMGLMHSEEGVVYGLGAHVVAAVCPGIDHTFFLIGPVWYSSRNRISNFPTLLSIKS